MRFLRWCATFAIVASLLLASSTAQATTEPTGSPVIIGTPVVQGAFLTVGQGTWQAPITDGYFLWYVDGLDVGGGPQYQPRAADVGKTITVVVRVQFDGSFVTAASAPSDPVAPADLTITFTQPLYQTYIGDTLSYRTLATSTAGFVEGLSWSQRWLVDGVAVAGETGAQYVVRPQDGAHIVSVAVTARAPGFTTTTSTVAAPRVPLRTIDRGVVHVSNVDGEVGEIVRVTTKFWDPASPDFALLWTCNGKPMKGAHGYSHRLSWADRGCLIRVKVTATLPYWVAASSTSPSIDLRIKSGIYVGPPPGKLVNRLPKPTVAGGHSVGQRASARASGWKGYGLRIDYQWYRDSTTIAGATGANYTPKRLDRGHSLSLRVTLQSPLLRERNYTVKLKVGTVK